MFNPDLSRINLVSCISSSRTPEKQDNRGFTRLNIQANFAMTQIFLSHSVKTKCNPSRNVTNQVSETFGT